MQHLTKQERKVVKAFVKELKDALRDNLVSIRLFGSKARGDNGKDSDIDVFVLVKKKTPEIRDTMAGIEVEYDINYGLPISTVLYSLLEYTRNKQLRSFFVENVEKEGVLL